MRCACGQSCEHLYQPRTALALEEQNRETTPISISSIVCMLSVFIFILILGAVPMARSVLSVCLSAHLSTCLYTKRLSWRCLLIQFWRMASVRVMVMAGGALSWGQTNPSVCGWALGLGLLGTSASGIAGCLSGSWQ